MSMQAKGKRRADIHSERMYYKDWESLMLPQTKIAALASALEEAETIIEVLKNKIEELENNLVAQN